MMGLLSGFGMPVGAASMLIAIALCVHAVRTGQPMYWLWLILVFQPLGGLVYFIAILLPTWTGGVQAQRLQSGARTALDPGREYRQAKAAHADSPTVGNQLRLAKAAAAKGGWQEAEALFAQAAQGVHAEDPVLLLGRATALIELGRAETALPVLTGLGEDPQEGRNPAIILALARVYEALGRNSEAEAAYEQAAGRMPGLEGLGRYAAFLARTGRTAQAQQAVADMDRRIASANPQFRKDGRHWRDLAAQALVKR